MIDKAQLSHEIKEYALKLGFDACGICKAEHVGEEENHLKTWLDKLHHANMSYMTNHFDKRCNPLLLVDGARSIVSVALNYYPREKQAENVPQVAYYAYGKDYHEVVKDKLNKLFEYLQTILPSVSGRVFCDTAPLLERYWATKAGLGFVGKNSMLIIPKKGSYFFLGELVLDIDLVYDRPIEQNCGNCRRCIDACPTEAIVSPKVVDSRRCISYQTIENRGEIEEEIKPMLNNRFYGCDICQQVCPWNIRFASPHTTNEFNPSFDFLQLDYDRLNSMTILEYQTIFKGSAIKRAKYAGLKRNMEALKK